MRKRSWIRLVITLALATIVGWGMLGNPPSDADRLASLSSRVACPVCENSIADSQSAYARNIRAYIAAEISQGQSDRQILDGLANSFGDEIIIDPSTSGLGLALWVAPGLAIFIGAWAMRSLRRGPRADSP
ncbi:MAG: cytochrome c-type biogenesis protein CcmH [Acidimicrobiia bacterium]|nr:cytochrome c-type biogenesis protein CcmH [Acidimicrobiia bacterium]